MTTSLETQGNGKSAELRSSRHSVAEAPEDSSPRKRRGPRPKLRGEEADWEAKRLCAIILDVLGGGRTPTEASETLGVSVPRYYALEARALGGLLEACRRRPKGRQRTPQGEIVKLEADVKRLENQSARWQALLRASQRAAGLAPPPPKKPAVGPGKKRKKRRAQVRALRAAAALREGSEKPLETLPSKRDDAREVKA